MLVALTLLLVSSPVRVHDEAEVSVQAVSDQLGTQRSSIHTGNYAHNISNSLASDYDNLEESVAVLAPTGKIETNLARLTVYWPEEGDDFTKRRLSSSGVQLRDGHCAVDPKVIPYGSVVKIPGMGEYVAVDTGPAVVSRRAARQAGRTSRERNALVVDVYCSSRSKAQVFEANAPDFAVISWYR
jgi:3D (Asp-Asp-Asp) domain-containing protein